MTEKDILSWSNKNKREISLKLFGDIKNIPSDGKPFAIFMAGSPGAGKTETSKRFVEHLKIKEILTRIDPDEIREEFSPVGYNGENAHLYQAAVSAVINKTLDNVFKYNKNFILDGTFSKYEASEKNIERAISKNYYIDILYVYQDPLLAWIFVQEREKVEKRKIRKEDFIDQYFLSKENVNKIKDKFQKNVSVNLLIKDMGGKLIDSHLNIEKIDFHIPEKYTRENLEKML